MPDWLEEELQVVNVGLPAFGEAIRAAGGAALDVEWAPPGPGDPEVARRLARLINQPRIEAANRTAYDAYLAAQPVLEGIGMARELIAGMGERAILHAGPPIAWAGMCGPMQGAIVGAILYEGWADRRRRRRGARGGRRDRLRALPSAGRGRADGGRDQPLDAGLDRGRSRARQPRLLQPERGARQGAALRRQRPRGASSRLRWMRDVLAPALAAALEVSGGLELKPLIAQALHMGDEVHNRNVAASSLLLKRLVPALLRTDVAPAEIAAVVDFIAGNDHFFLNLSMAACKAMLDAAAGVPGSSLVTAMARNGVEFGIRLSGTGDAWFTAPAPVVEGLLFPGYTSADAAPDLGDSAITETAGLGGFAMAASPAIVQFVGGSPQDAIANSLEMGHITLGRNGAFTLPALDFTGTPAGIDARKVVDSGIAPIINTGIAHKQAGIGQIGAGITRAPLACFAKAILALAEQVEAA